MKYPTPKQQVEQHYKVDPAELEPVITVHRELVYLLKDRRHHRMYPIFKKNGLPVLERTPSGKDWRRVYLHPGNVYSPAMHPLPGDFVKLLDADNQPCENHAEVFMCSDYESAGPVWTVETMNSESFRVTRLPDEDNELRRAWVQVVTS